MRRLLVAAALLLLARTAGAQAIRGVVLDAADKPVAGVIVLLVDAASHEAARTLSNEKGEFRLVAPIAGAYRVRTLRIGFRSVTSDRIDVTGEDETPRRFTLSTVAVVLDTTRTSGKNSCRVVAKDSAALTFALWEQVRAALTATQVTASGRTMLVTTEAYYRTLDAGYKHIHSQSTDFRTDFVRQPWRSLPPDSLRRAGYITTQGNNVRIYNAPGMDALLSTTFLDDHCLRLETLKDPKVVGITFEPTSDRKDIAEIHGMLTLDRASAELRSLTFQYANVSREERNNAGGDMEFARMRNGMWAISRWSIRMPTIVLIPTYNNDHGSLIQTGQDTRVDSIKVTGGEIVVAMMSTTHGRDTIWTRPKLVLAGTVLDSVSGHPLSGTTVSVSGTPMTAVSDAAGKFAILDLLPGQYMLEVHTPSLDSVNTLNQTSVLFTDSAGPISVRVPSAGQIATSLCGKARADQGGIIIGSVDIVGDTVPPSNAKVVATWTQTSIQGGVITSEPHMTDARTNARGVFRLCGMPVNTTLILQASTDSASSSSSSARIATGQRFASVALTLDQQRAAGGVFVGVVRIDSTNRPIADATVSLPDLTMSARTDSGGAFRLSGIPAGSQHVIIRHLGYGGVDTHIDFARNEVVNRQIVLNHVTVLDSVVTTAVHRDPEMDDFATNKAMGLGHFWTRADFAMREGAMLTSFLRQTPGLTLIRAVGGRELIGNSRPPRSQCAGLGPVEVGGSASSASSGHANIGQAVPISASSTTLDCLIAERVYYVPTQSEMNQGAKIACLARVYLDGQLLNSGDPAQPIDLSGFPPSQIEAVEFYATPAETPLKYMQRKDPKCGVLVIHTRRPP